MTVGVKAPKTSATSGSQSAAKGLYTLGFHFLDKAQYIEIHDPVTGALIHMDPDVSLSMTGPRIAYALDWSLNNPSLGSPSANSGIFSDQQVVAFQATFSAYLSGTVGLTGNHDPFVMFPGSVGDFGGNVGFEFLINAGSNFAGWQVTAATGGGPIGNRPQGTTFFTFAKGVSQTEISFQRGSGPVGTTSGAGLLNGNAAHIACNITPSTIQIWVNGTSVYNGALTSDTVTTSEIRFGATPDTPTNLDTATVQYFDCYPSLSAAQVAAHYAAASTRNAATWQAAIYADNPTAIYRLDDPGPKWYFPESVTVVGDRLVVLAQHRINFSRPGDPTDILIYDDAQTLTGGHAYEKAFSITREFIDRSVCIPYSDHEFVVGQEVNSSHGLVFALTRYDIDDMAMLTTPSQGGNATLFIQGAPTHRGNLTDLYLTQDRSRFLFTTGQANGIGPGEGTVIWQAPFTENDWTNANYVNATPYYQDRSYQGIDQYDTAQTGRTAYGDITNSRAEMGPDAFCYDQITGHSFILWDPAQEGLPTIIDEIDENAQYVRTWIPRASTAPTPAIVPAWTAPNFQPYSFYRDIGEWQCQGNQLGQVMQASNGILWVNMDLYWNSSAPGGGGGGGFFANPVGLLEDAVWRIDTNAGTGESDPQFRIQTNTFDRSTVLTVSYLFDMRIGGQIQGNATGTSSTQKVKPKMKVQHVRS